MQLAHAAYQPFNWSNSQLKYLWYNGSSFMCTFVLVTMIKALLASEAAPLVPFPVRGQGVPPALALQRYELIAGTPGSVFPLGTLGRVLLLSRPLNVGAPTVYTLTHTAHLHVRPSCLQWHSSSGTPYHSMYMVCAVRTF